MQNGVFVSGADEVTVDGFMARDYKANGFFFVNVPRLHDEPPGRAPDRRLRPVRVRLDRRLDPRLPRPTRATTDLGHRARRRRSGRSGRSSATSTAGNIPLRLGSPTNMRYVTITKSRFYNNAIGLAPNTLDPEKFPPRGQRDHRQRHLLRRPELPPGQPAFQGAGGRGRRRAGADIGTGMTSCSAARATRSEQRIYGNFLSGSTESSTSSPERRSPHARRTS